MNETKDNNESVIRTWSEWYVKANKNEPPIMTCKNGWFRVESGTYRRKQVLVMIENLKKMAEKK